MGVYTPGRVWRLKLFSTYLLQDCLNVFHYGDLAHTGDAVDLLATFISTVCPVIAPLQNVGVYLDHAEAEGIAGIADFATQPVALSGTVAGDGLPSYAAWGFRYNRSGAGQRNGYKRFAGVSEADQHDGLPTALAYARIHPLETALFSAFVGVHDTYFPLTEHKEALGVPLVTPIFWEPSAVVFQAITTQNTRKV